ncbi:hypothetical protein Naga_100046g26 [Nannochloropsis gaditana]|uniref:Uncharacterized protein n=1 Tax=Nannochloropsis gaditana TaxID=72520 RepID=W7TJ79_9STRA|nr:hypothetical protein Naga_100046g26 [Nannochloropsis gaditana]
MSMEEHTTSFSESGRQGSDGGLTDVLKDDESEAAAAVASTATEEEDEGAPSSQNVIPADSLANGFSVAKGFLASGWSQARKSIATLQDSEAVHKMREASKPFVGAVVEGGKVVGDRLHHTAEAAKPGLEAVGRRVSGAVEHLSERTRPALEKAGETIKKTTKQVVDEGKPMVKKVGDFFNDNLGGKKGGGGGDGDPPTTV